MSENEESFRNSRCSVRNVTVLARDLKEVQVRKLGKLKKQRIQRTFSKLAHDVTPAGCGLGL